MVVGQLETDLVVPLAGGAVGNGIAFFLGGDLHLPLGDQRPGDGGAQQVMPLVDGVGAEHGEHEIAHKLFPQVVDIDLVAPVAKAFSRTGASSSPCPRSAEKATTSQPYSFLSHLRMMEVSRPPE